MKSQLEEAHRNDEIEVLRAVAVLLVLVHHYPALLGNLNPPWYLTMEGLWSGVDLFFCISGYVIGRSLIPELTGRSGRIFWRAALAFWVKRWYRITPSAWLWIVALVAFNGVDILTKDAVFLKDAAAAVLHYANINFYLCTVAMANNCQNLHVYWSLSLEEQFYLLMPFVIFVFRRWLGLAMLIVALVQMAMVRHHWQGLSFVRTDAIALGVMLAVVSFRPVYLQMEPRHFGRFGSTVLVLLLLCCVVLVPTLKLTERYMGLLALNCLTLVWLASYQKGYVMPACPARGWLVHIGKRSFSIYLAHIVAFALAEKIVWLILLPSGTPVVVRTGLLLLTGALTLMIVVEFSYRFVELPWRARGRRIATRLMA